VLKNLTNLLMIFVVTCIVFLFLSFFVVEAFIDEPMHVNSNRKLEIESTTGNLTEGVLCKSMKNTEQTILAKEFKSQITQFRKVTPKHKLNKLSNFCKTDEDFVSMITGTKIICSEKVDQLCQEFLDYKIKYGSSEEIKLYTAMDVEAFKYRLISKRPLAFFGATEDPAKLRSGAPKYNEIQQYITLDERLISTFLGVSFPTHFVNSGSRYNEGVKAKSGTFISAGTYVGLVGARFETHENESRFLTKAGQIREAAKGKEWMRIWENFYGIADFSSDHNKFFNGRYDLSVFNKHLQQKLLPLLDEHKTDPSDMRPAYMHIVGLGTGAWAPVNMEAQIEHMIYESLVGHIANGDFSNVAVLDFSWFPSLADLISSKEYVQDVNGHKIILLCTKNDPASLTPLKEGKRLVATFAWDGNSYPGNEYFCGMLTASGDPAAACCSTIVDQFVARFGRALHLQ